MLKDPIQHHPGCGKLLFGSAKQEWTTSIWSILCQTSNWAHECAKNVFLLDLPGCCLRSTPPLNAMSISDRAHCGIVLPSVNRLQKPRPQPFGPVKTRFHSLLKIGPGVMSRPHWEWWTTSKQPVCLHALGLQTHKDNLITGRAQIKITIQWRYLNYQSADCIS